MVTDAYVGAGRFRVGAGAVARRVAIEWRGVEGYVQVSSANDI